jgi:hypothetical protein
MARLSIIVIMMVILSITVSGNGIISPPCQEACPPSFFMLKLLTGHYYGWWKLGLLRHFTIWIGSALNWSGTKRRVIAQISGYLMGYLYYCCSQAPLLRVGSNHRF